MDQTEPRSAIYMFGSSTFTAQMGHTCLFYFSIEAAAFAAWQLRKLGNRC